MGADLTRESPSPSIGTGVSADLPAEETIAGTLADTSAESAAEPSVERGAKIGRYVVVDRIGRGGMGVVHRAYDPDLARMVAVKLVVGDGSGATLREAQAAARLNHPNVVQVYDVGTYGPATFLAMELVQGGTLEAHAKALEEGGDRWELLRELFVQAAAGLSAAHGAGLVHRDFKPANVLIGRDGRARVADFGLARAGEHSAAARAATELLGVDTTDQTAKSDRRVQGTPRYMSPEQHAGADIDARTDVFAYCVSLWWALYGSFPFEGRTLMELALAIGDGPREPEHADRAPAYVRRALERGLASDKDARWPDMASLLAALLDDPRRRRRRFVAIGGVALAVGGLVGGNAWLDRAKVERLNETCVDAVEPVAKVWSRERAEALRESFEASAGGYGAYAASAVDRAVRDWSAQWVNTRGGLCQERGLPPLVPELAELAQREDACLDRRLAELDATLASLEAVDASGVSAAAKAVFAVRRPASCAGDGSKHVLEHDPEFADAASRLRGTLHTAAAKDAVPASDALVTSAGDDVSKRAEALGLRARARHASGDLPGAAQDAVEATLSAELAGRDDLRQDAYEQRFWVERALDDRDAALEAARLSWALEARLPTDPVRHTKAEERLGIALSELGQYEKAREHLESAYEARVKWLGADDPNLVTARGNLATVLWRAGDRKGASEQTRRAVEDARHILGPDHPHLAVLLGNLGTELLVDGGGLDEALPVFEEAVAVAARAHGKRHPAYARRLLYLAPPLADAQRPEDALVIFGEAIDVLSEHFEPHHVHLVEAVDGRAWTLRTLGRLEEARREYDQLLALIDGHLDEVAMDDVVIVLVDRAEVLADLGDFDAAQADLDRAIALLDESGEPSFQLSVAHASRVKLALRRNDPAAARGEFERYHPKDDPSARDDELMRARFDGLEGRLLLLEGEPDAALPGLERAYEAYRRAYGAANLGVLQWEWELARARGAANVSEGRSADEVARELEERYPAHAPDSDDGR